jgi:hypothetical protein
MRRRGSIEASATIQAILALLVIVVVAHIAMNLVANSVGKTGEQQNEKRQLAELADAIENKCSIAAGTQSNDQDVAVGSVSVEIAFRQIEKVSYDQELEQLKATFRDDGDTLNQPASCSLGVNWQVEEYGQVSTAHASTWRFEVGYDSNSQKMQVTAVPQ